MLASLINNYRPKGKKAASSAAKPTTPFSRRTADPASSQPYGPQVYDIGGAKSSFEDGDAASSTRSFEPTASHVSAAPTESVVSPRVDIDIDFTPADWFPSHFLKTDSVVGPGVLGGRSIADVLAAPPPGTSSSSSSRAAAAAVADSFDVGNDDGLETEDEDDDDDADVLDADVLNPQQMTGLSNRKGAPAPIKIPNVAIHAPKVQIDRSASTVSRPESMFSLEGASAISGTTLARALIGDAFVLSHDRSSRYRSGASVLTRSDSATLPRGDFLFSPGRRSGPLSGTFTPLDADGVVPPMPDLPAEVKRAIAESRDRLRVDDESERSPGAGFRSGAEARTPDTAVSETPVSRITESSSPVSLDPPASENAESEPTTPSRPPLVHVGLSLSAFPISPGQESTAATSEARSSRDIGDVLDYYNFDSSPGGGSDRSGFDPPSPDSGPLEGPQLLGPARFQPAFSPITEEDSLSQSQLSPDSIRSRMTGAKSLAPSPSPSPASARWPGDVRILPRTPSGNMTMVPSPLTIPPTNSLRPSSAATDEDDEELDGDDGDDGDDNELLPPPRGIFARQRAGGAPSPIQVVRDSRDPNAYNITVTQRAEPSSAGSTPATEYDFSRQQSFPETPSAFSPLFSSGIDSEQRHSMMPPSTGTASANELPSLAQQVLLSRASTSVRGGRQSRARNRSTAIWPSASVSAAVKDMLPVSPDQGPLCDEEKQQMVVVEEEEAEPEPEPEPKAETVEELRTPSEPPDSASVYSASVQSFRSRAAQRLSQASMQAEPVEDSKRQKPLPAMPNSPVESELEMDMPGAASSTSLRAASIAASVSVSASPHTEPLPLSRRSSTKSSDEAAPALGSPPPYSVNDGHSTPDSDQFVTPRLSVQSVVATPGPSRRSRARPPLPVGPRRPSTSGPAAAALQGPRNRNGSVSSVASTPGGRRVTSTAPRFQTPPIKWRGYTMEAAKWTFSSSQLQDIVSRAIRQSSEASSIRLLNLDTVDVEIPEELHRLEMQRTDVKTRYKMLTRKRAGLLASLDASIEVDEILRVVESVKEISAELDRLAEDLHSADEQITQLTSLRDVHSSSALAMALRKLNASFLKQITASEALRAQIEMLQAERDEAWTQAVDVAHELDDLSERMSPGGYTNNNNRRSSRVLASKKSSIRMSKTGLRSRRSSVSSSVGPALDDMDIPPVPPIPRPHEIRTSGLSAVSSANSETRALDQAQQELYSMLGITDIPTRRQSYVEQSPGGALSSAPSRPSSLPGTVYNNTDDRNAMLATLGLLSD
ncbi:unnamed protein product [Mycena citricolor]|uniref:Uncharacterized protein n=1 Tax=Mycena citricolor TaxID=2018698 RepID=A0AAD2HN09_9AGAR|nr:unnamed protein product [Mycena citricolor]